MREETGGLGPEGVSRRVLVTGGAGFIGSHVADAYLARGDQVWVVDDLSSGKRENVPKRATFCEISIEDPALVRLFSEVGFDLVNHHAAQIDVRSSVADPQKDARTNILGLLNVLESARRTGTRRVIYVSSGGVVYGEPELIPTPESAPKDPRSPYGVTKICGELYLNYYREVHGLSYVALRYSNVFLLERSFTSLVMVNRHETTCSSKMWLGRIFSLPSSISGVGATWTTLPSTLVREWGRV
jgi:UDP-glucose 4-epimerase